MPEGKDSNGVGVVGEIVSIRIDQQNISSRLISPVDWNVFPVDIFGG